MSGMLYIVGMGPGDPELVTLKAARVLKRVDVLAYFAKRGRVGHARGIAEGLVREGVRELRFEYPYTTEIAHLDPEYRAAIDRFYGKSSEIVASVLDEGLDVALLCEGDPFFYGSAMYVFDRLRGGYACEVVPGVAGMSGCWSRAGLAMVHGDDVMSIVPGTLDEAALTVQLACVEAAVIMKVGRNFAKIRRVLGVVGMLERAVYVERGTMTGEVIAPLAAVDAPGAPYFSMILVPGRQGVR